MRKTLEWDDLDGGCQKAVTPIGSFTAWQGGALKHPDRETTYHENIQAAKAYAENRSAGH